MSALRFVSKVDLQILQFLLHSEQFTLPLFALHDELENTDGYVNRLANLSQFIVADTSFSRLRRVCGLEIFLADGTR